MTRHLRIYDHFTIPHLSNTATAWRMPPQHPPGSEGSRRDGCGTRGQNRCPGAAAGPGRASRSTTPSRRLACGDLAGGPPPTGTWTKQLGLQRVPHAGRLFRTWAGLPRLGTAGHVRMRRPRLHIAGLRALRRAWCRAVPLLSHAGRLFRTWAAYSARGPPVPYMGGVAQTRNSRPRADEKAQAPHSGLARIAASLV